MVVYAKNIYDIVDLFYYPMKMLSMAPFSKVKERNNIRIYKPSSLGLKEFLHLGTVLMFIIVTAGLRTLTFFGASSKTTFADYFYGTIYWIIQFVNSGKIVELFFNQKHFVHCFNLMEKLDKLLVSKIYSQISMYKNIHIFLICFLTYIPLNMVITMAPIWEFIESVQLSGWGSVESLTLIVQLLNLTPIFMVRDLSMYIFIIFIGLTLCRTINLRQHISAIEKSNDKVEVKGSFILVSDMHHIIFQLTEELNGTFGWSLLWNVTICFFEIIAVTVSMKYNHLLKIHQAIIGLFPFIFGTIAILTICHKLKLQINMLKKALSDVTLSYCDAECSEILQLLQLQLNHEHIDLHCYQVYSMDMTVLTIHMGTILTLIMFFLKLQEVIQME